MEKKNEETKTSVEKTKTDEPEYETILDWCAAQRGKQKQQKSK